jgi:hypothetical protein
MTKWATWIRSQFVRGVLRQAAQRELAHGEGGQVRVALDTGTGARQQERAAAMWDHAPRRLADRQETTKRCDLDGLVHGFRIEFRDRAVCAGTGVVEHDIGFAEPVIHPANKRETSAGSEASTAKACAPVSAASDANFSTLRAAKPTWRPAAARPRATDALMPEPAPTIKAMQ